MENYWSKNQCYFVDFVEMLNYEMNYRTLEEGFKGLSFKTKCSIYFGTRIKRLKKIIGMENEKSRR